MAGRVWNWFAQNRKLKFAIELAKFVARSVVADSKSVFSAIERTSEWLLTILPKIELTSAQPYA
jgi:hypothetical protein